MSTSKQQVIGQFNSIRFSMAHVLMALGQKRNLLASKGLDDEENAVRQQISKLLDESMTIELAYARALVAYSTMGQDTHELLAITKSAKNARNGDKKLVQNLDAINDVINASRTLIQIVKTLGGLFSPA